jgi:hypothetical protein
MRSSHGHNSWPFPRTIAGRDLPRLQNKDARQRSSAAQPEDGLDEGIYQCPQCGTETKRALKT